MLSPQANLRLLQRTSWSGFVYIAFLMVGIWPLAGFFPSQPPSWDAAQITRIYHDNTVGIRIGMVLVLVGSMFYVPWTAMLAKLIAAVEGKPGILTFSQIIAGCTNVLLTAYPAGWWLTASFRSDRDPQIVQLLNDIAWLLFITPIAPFMIQNVAIGVAILNDARQTLPRWVGYVNLWVAFLFIPDPLAFFFHSGPFAWRGIFIFWLALAAYTVFLVVMGVTLRQAIRASSDPDVSAVHAAAA